MDRFLGKDEDDFEESDEMYNMNEMFSDLSDKVIYEKKIKTIFNSLLKVGEADSSFMGVRSRLRCQ